MDKIPRSGENQTMAELIEITESRQIVEVETRLRLHTYKKYAWRRTQFTGEPKHAWHSAITPTN